VEALQAIRDIAIIILALETIAIGAVGLLLGWQVWRLVRLARDHCERLMGLSTQILGTVKGTADTAADTARHARGTVEFVGDRTALPVIQLYSAIAGASRFARAVFRFRRNGRNGERS
jgi:hypothetical protein